MKKNQLIPAFAALLAALLCLSACGEKGTHGAATAAGTGEAASVIPDEPDTEPERMTETEVPETEPQTEPDPVTEAPTEPETEPPTEAATEADTEPEGITVPLGTLLDGLSLDEGLRLSSEGKLTLGVSMFGMVIHTDLPMNGCLSVGEAGVMLSGEMPMAGQMELRFVNNLLYLTAGERKLVFSLLPPEEETLPEADTLPEAEPQPAETDAVPDEADDEETDTQPEETLTDTPGGFDFSALTALWDELKTRLGGALRELPVTLPADGGLTYTVKLPEWAASVADAMESEDTPDGSASALLEWMRLLAADESAALSVTADPTDPAAPLILTLDCPVSTQVLTRLMSLLSGITDIAGGTGSGSDVSELLSQAVSDARFSLTVTLSGGAQEILPPDDAEAYEPFVPGARTE